MSVAWVAQGVGSLTDLAQVETAQRFFEVGTPALRNLKTREWSRVPTFS